MTVQQLQTNMTAAEYRGWVAFCAEEPLPQSMGRWAVGELLAAVGNGPMARDDGEALQGSDFIAEAWAEKDVPLQEDNTSFEALQSFLGGLQ